MSQKRHQPSSPDVDTGHATGPTSVQGAEASEIPGERGSVDTDPRRIFSPISNTRSPDQRLILQHRPFDPPASADHRAVIPLTHPDADLRKIEFRGLAHEEHRHAPRQADRSLAAA